MFISHSKRFIFVHIPKTAGTSIASVLEPYCEKAEGTRFRRLLRKAGVRQDPRKAHFRSHDYATQVLAAFGREVYETYSSFSVVRNPFDHAVSHYFYLREFPKKRVADFFGNADFATYLDFRSNPGRYPRMPPFAKFGDQTEFLYDKDGRCLVDRILRFENLSQDFNDLLISLGLPARELPTERVTKSRNGSLDACFKTQTEIDSVHRLYDRDFKNFGYDRALPRGT